MSAAAQMEAGPRRAYTYRTAAHDYSTSVAALRRAVAAGRVRTRSRGRSVLLDPGDLELHFGFGRAPESAGVIDPLTASILEALDG